MSSSTLHVSAMGFNTHSLTSHCRNISIASSCRAWTFGINPNLSLPGRMTYVPIEDRPEQTGAMHLPMFWHRRFQARGPQHTVNERKSWSSCIHAPYSWQCSFAKIPTHAPPTSHNVQTYMHNLHPNILYIYITTSNRNRGTTWYLQLRRPI
jgi:hypothetical protein